MTQPAYSVSLTLHWDAAHRLHPYEGLCANLHGHRFLANITYASDALNEEGMVIDFKEIKRSIGQWIDTHWDHAFIYNRDDPLGSEIAHLLVTRRSGSRVFAIDGNPSAENLARTLFARAQELCPVDIEVVSVQVFETPVAEAQYMGVQRFRN